MREPGKTVKFIMWSLWWSHSGQINGISGFSDTVKQRIFFSLQLLKASNQERQSCGMRIRHLTKKIVPAAHLLKILKIFFNYLYHFKLAQTCLQVNVFLIGK